MLYFRLCAPVVSFTSARMAEKEDRKEEVPMGQAVTTSSMMVSSSRPQTARQLRRQQGEMDERRRYGLAPLEVDAVASAAAGKTVEISPNVPAALARAPWFYEVDGPTLTHQRLAPDVARRPDVLQDRVDKATVLGKAKGFTPGACQNCGSRTHETRHCFHAKKKVSCKYTGVVVGKDIHVEVAKDKTYAQKRDRYVGPVGTDLLERYAPGDDETAEGEKNEKQRRRLDLFSSTAAQHGGVEIKPVPKYLQNMDAMERGQVFFDPRTGSMRGDPNAASSSTADTATPKTYRGDLAQYCQGDYHVCVEQQYRFLTGASRSIVDFEFDAAVSALKKIQEKVLRRHRPVSANKQEEEEGSDDEVDGDDSPLRMDSVSPETISAAAAALGIPFPLPAAFSDYMTTTATRSGEEKQQRDVTRAAEHIEEVVLTQVFGKREEGVVDSGTATSNPSKSSEATPSSPS